MNYGLCTAKATGEHRTQSGKDRCPVHGRGGASSRGWTPRTPSSWPSSRTPAPIPQSVVRRYDAHAVLVAQLSEAVLDLMLNGTDEAVQDAAFALIDELTPPGETKIPRRSHALCLLFEAVAVGLQSLLDVPSKIVDEVVSDELGGSRVLAACARALLTTAINAALQPATAPLKVVHVQACVLAIALCPDTVRHASLEMSCAPTAARAAVDGEISPA